MEWRYIAPGKPTQNGYVEIVNVSLRVKLFNQTLFLSLAQVRVEIAAWVEECNRE